DPEYNNPGTVLDPYVTDQYEIGAKYQVTDRALLNMAIFRIEKANVFDEENTALSIGTPGRITRTQDGLQVHQGVELNITGKLTDNLTVMAGGTYMDLQ